MDSDQSAQESGSQAAKAETLLFATLSTPLVRGPWTEHLHWPRPWWSHLSLGRRALPPAPRKRGHRVATRLLHSTEQMALALS